MEQEIKQEPNKKMILGLLFCYSFIGVFGVILGVCYLVIKFDLIAVICALMGALMLMLSLIGIWSEVKDIEDKEVENETGN